jgi:tetratricopeptide (TPR) repeat protein
MGSYQRKITTRSPEAQKYFDQGMVLAYAFNHAEAARSFEAAAQLDPTCAMAFWGAALVRGPHVNSPMNDDDVPKAWDAIQNARKVAQSNDRPSDVERELIDALSKRYAQQPMKDRSSLDRAYADAMRDVARRFPSDADVQTLFAEALMDTMPWDYWTKDITPKPETEEVLRALERAIELDPMHAGANHLYIHAVEAGPTPQKGLASADRLRDAVPGAGHLVHMPAHIYLRLGLYHEASRANHYAIEADKQYLDACRVQGFFPLAYYPHNIHFLWYSTSMEGRSADCIAAARLAASYVTKHCGAVEANAQRPLPLLAMARFGKWHELLAEPRPQMDKTFDVAIWNYARGVAFARTGKLDEARHAYGELVRISQSEEAKRLDSLVHPATQVLAVAQHDLAAEVARAGKDTQEWLAQLRKSVEAQDALPYMEPPYWYLPQRQSLGAALLELGQHVEAEKVYREDLKRNPSNGWSLKGLEKSIRAQGKTAQADEVQRQFEFAWRRADVKIESSRL